MQVGLYTGLARDFEFDNYFRNTLAHAAIGKLFPIPVIITTSVESGMLERCSPDCILLIDIRSERSNPR
jgi:hypothetical protein